MQTDFSEIVSFIRNIYNTQDSYIPLHEPRFRGNEKKYLNECIDSTFVSSVGRFVAKFEEMIAEYTGAKHAIATVNGTAALHIALLLSDVKPDDEVISQALTFVSTANAISYTEAIPVFIDVDPDTLGLSPESLLSFLEENSVRKNGSCINKISGRRIKVCVPVHTFGHPCQIEKIIAICNEYNISVIEDAAESLGSWYKEQHTGTFGKFGILSFNGNKIITTGGGGMILTNDDKLAKTARHITTTAKVPHKWEFVHDATGYNYRLTNLAAALGCAQMEQLSAFIENKRELANAYKSFLKKINLHFFSEPADSVSNYWLNALILKDIEERNKFLEIMNEEGIMSRPIWQLMSKLKMYRGCQHNELKNTEWLVDRVVNIPSSVRL